MLILLLVVQFYVKRHASQRWKNAKRGSLFGLMPVCFYVNGKQIWQTRRWCSFLLMLCQLFIHIHMTLSHNSPTEKDKENNTISKGMSPLVIYNPFTLSKTPNSYDNAWIYDLFISSPEGDMSFGKSGCCSDLPKYIKTIFSACIIKTPISFFMVSYRNFSTYFIFQAWHENVPYGMGPISFCAGLMTS